MKIEHYIKTDKFYNEQHKAILSLIATHSWINAKIIQNLKPHKISRQQYNVLRILKGSHPKPLSVLDIKNRLIDKYSNISRLIEKMRKNELVRTNSSKEDRRMLQVSLTKKGELLEKGVTEGIPDFYEQFNHISIKEAKILTRILDSLREG